MAKLLTQRENGYKALMRVAALRWSWVLTALTHQSFTLYLHSAQ
jgi:hypothetical protein